MTMCSCRNGNEVFQSIISFNSINMMNVPPLGDFTVGLRPNISMLKLPMWFNCQNIDSAVSIMQTDVAVIFSPSLSMIITVFSQMANWFITYRTFVALLVRPTKYIFICFLSVNFAIHNLIIAQGDETCKI